MAQRKNAAPALIDGLTSDLSGRALQSSLIGSTPPCVGGICKARPAAAGVPQPRRESFVLAGGDDTYNECLLLVKRFNLSDPQLEECLQNRLSFRRLDGLSLTDATPDETTFVVFRHRLREASVQEFRSCHPRG